MATGLDASMLFLSTSRRCIGIGHLVGYLFYQEYLFAHSARYARDDFDGDAREVISNLNGCFGSIFSQLYE